MQKPIFAFLIALGIVMVIVALVVVFTKAPWMQPITGGTGLFETRHNPQGVAYELFYIEGMPCMRIGRGFGTNGMWTYDGVTCDWSKWTGR